MQAWFSLLVLLVGIVGVQALPFCPMKGCDPTVSYLSLAIVPSAPLELKWQLNSLNGTSLRIKTGGGCSTAGSNAYCTVQNLNGLLAVAPNGSVLWQSPILSDAEAIPLVLGFGGTAVISHDAESIALLVANGSPGWALSSTPTLFSPALNKNLFFILGDKRNGGVVAIDPNGLSYASLDFTVPGGTFGIVSTPPVIGNRNYVLTQFHADEGKEQKNMFSAYAIDLHVALSGRLNISWVYSMDGNVTNSQAMSVNDPKSGSNSLLIPYLDTDDVLQIVCILDKGDSYAYHWQTSLNTYNTTAFLASDGNEMVVASVANTSILHFVDLITGFILRSVDMKRLLNVTNDVLITAPALLVGQGNSKYCIVPVFICEADTSVVVAIDMNSISLAWSVKVGVGKENTVVSNVIVLNGVDGPLVVVPTAAGLKAFGELNKSDTF